MDISEGIRDIIAETMDDAEPDEQCAAIASMAATTFLANILAGNSDETIKGVMIGDDDQNNGESNTNNTLDDSDSIEGFNKRCGMPMAELMEAYGEFEPLSNINMTPPPAPTSTRPVTEKKTKKQDSDAERFPNSVLNPNGLAPIHFKIVSFGYTYGVPSTPKGFSSSTPLPPFDIRDSVPKTEKGLMRFSGFNSKVKSALLRNRNEEAEDGKREDTKTWKVIKDIGRRIFEAFAEAEERGAGWTQPLSCEVHIGSDFGRHRSIVIVEAVAVCVRRLLRENEGKRLSVKCSVSTAHRDIDREHKKEAYGKKEKREDDDW